MAEIGITPPPLSAGTERRREKMMKFFFDHIYKAGGSSVENAFLQWLDPADVTPVLTETATSALQNHADKRLITGHFHLLPGQWLDHDRYALTMLRHPVDRIISHYYFAKADVGPRGGDVDVELTRQFSFEEYVHSDAPEVRIHLDNHQVTHFFPLVWDGLTDLSPSERLELAKQGLRHYDLVGVFEEFEDFLTILAIDAGWRPLERIPRVNVTRKRPRLADVDGSVVKHLEDLNQLDIALYEYARRLFQSKRRQVLRRCATAFFGQKSYETAPSGSELLPDLSGPSVASPKPPDYAPRPVELLQASLGGAASIGPNEVPTGDVVCLRVDFRAHQPVEKLVLLIAITDAEGHKVFGTHSRALGKTIRICEPGDYYGEFRFRCDLAAGRYRVAAAIRLADDLFGMQSHSRDAIAHFTVLGNMGYFWEGLVKLYPSLQCGAAAASAQQNVSLVDVDEDWPRTQRIAVHTQPLTDFNATIRLLGEIERMKPNEVVAVELEICNSGTQSWGSIGLRPVCVSYHWLDDSGQLSVFDGERTRLPHDIQPNGTVRLWATVKTPPTPGNYALLLTLVQEYVAWFDQTGCLPQTVHIRVE
jgi:hypothetical protein